MKFLFNCDKKYFLNSDLRKTLEDSDFSELSARPLIQEEQQGFSLSIPDKETSDFLGILNDEIVCRGMDNQETVNETGKMLYWIYDEILIQNKKNL